MSERITAAELAQLARRRIFFGHRSVGANLMQGVQELFASESPPVPPVVETHTPREAPGPGILHAQIGENGDPAFKSRAFVEIVDDGFAGDIALHKYCYVDVTPTTDVRRLFDAYRASMEALRARHPSLVVAHVTVPLTTMETPFKAVVKRLLGRPAAYRDANTKRSEYNRLMLEEYGTSGTVFDLARLQSTRLDGSRVEQTVNGKTTYGLARELTVDGGHLNDVARPMFATAFLKFLAVLPLQR